MTQPTLDGTPAHTGLWRKVVDGHQIDHAAWLRAIATGDFVGSCKCGDFLTPSRPQQVGDRTDYSATCRREECRWEINAPGGRILRRSSMASERPKRS